MSDHEKELLGELQDSEYRHAFASDFLDMTLARQIRAIRKARRWSQAKLASRIGTQQSFISAIEKEDYGSLSISKLKEIAGAFDVYLSVRFESFAELVRGLDHTSMKELVVPAFDDDLAMQVLTTETENVQVSPRIMEAVNTEVLWSRVRTAHLTSMQSEITRPSLSTVEIQTAA